MIKVKRKPVTLWFRTVSMGNRKSCPTCGCKLAHDEHIWTWGEYIRAKWHNVAHFCKECFDKQVEPLAIGFCVQNNRTPEITCKDSPRPLWLVLPENIPYKD